MKRISLFSAAAVLSLAASPLSAQAVITGFDDLHWGASRDSVQRYWRETPASETRQGEWTFLRFADWEGMQWMLAVHETQGFQQFLARSLASPSDPGCQRVFEEYVARIRRLYSGITPEGGVNNPGGGNLCAAVAAGRATARFVWSDPANSAAAVVFIDPTHGRMAYMHAGAPFMTSANASSAMAQAVATLLESERLTGYDSRVWDPRAPGEQLAFGTPADEIRSRYGRPFREDSDDVGPGMTNILYTDDNGGGLVFTVHRTGGLVRVINSTGLSVPDLPCNQFWARARDRVAARFAGVTPQGGAHNPRGGDLCDQVKAGNAFAEMVWVDPAGGPTVWLRVGPSTGVISIATASPQFHQWFDTSALGRERWERVRRAGGGR